ncbi:MAG TPA: aspartate--tRNA(Asn) ligase [Streptosporangiaceae bacterium]|nr:aspartate--tRNA(Asn) ligase [Streptosporangiaceae bacterium]
MSSQTGQTAMTQSTAQTGLTSDTEPGTQTGPGPQAEPSPQTEPGTQARTGTQSGSRTQAEPSPQTEPGAKPAAAPGEQTRSGTRVLAGELLAHVGQRVTIAGWLHRKRQLKSVTFLVIRDRTGLAQVVLAGQDAISAAAGLTEETVLQVTGLVKASRQAPGGAEIAGPAGSGGPKLTVLSGQTAPPPFDLYRPAIAATLPTILDHAPTTLRHPLLRSGFEIAAASAAGFRTALDERSFTEIFTPKIVESATESGANVFGIDYFGRPAYLAQSPQFYKQAMVGVFERVYEVAPAFRAEPHDTARHLAQFTSLDAELALFGEHGIGDHRDVMAVLRDVIAAMVTAVAERAGPAAELLHVVLPVVPEPIPQLHFVDAQELIARSAGWDPTGEPDLSPADERWLCEWAVREHGSEFLFVTGYPAVAKPFYTHPDPARPGYTNGFDLLFRGLELVTGGQRLHRHEDYLAALASRGEDPAPYAGYLQIFSHGMPPHGGFAIGLERWTARLTGAANVRQVTMFPRDIHRLSP